MNPVLLAAREALENLTPLKTDCGRCCGAACCRSAEGEETGMLLFPGEEDLYEDLEGYEMKALPRGTLLICGGKCERKDRPLACRIFPLIPVVTENGIRAVTDLLAKSVCPLARQGKNALDPTFVETVRTIGEKLAEEPEQKAFLEELTEEQRELKKLKNRLGG